MSKEEIIQLLKERGFHDDQIISKFGGIEVIAEKRVPAFEFDYYEFLRMFDGKLDEEKVHMLDPWTFTVECS